MPLFLVLACDDERLRITDHMDYDTFRNVVKRGDTFDWCHQGLVRRIPNAVLQNLVAVYDAHFSTRQSKIARDVPANLGCVTWDQTVSRPPYPKVS